MSITKLFKKSIWICLLPLLATSCNQSEKDSADASEDLKGASSVLADGKKETLKTHRLDVIPLVARYHQNPAAYSKALREKYDGLKDTARIDQLIREENYVEALKFVWSEPDYAKQVNYMVEKANEGHPIFMMEVSLAALRIKPELNTLKSFFAWEKAGIARTVQDLNCVSDASAKAATAKLDFIYQTSVNRILQVDPKAIESYFFKHQKEIDQAIYAHVRKVLANSLRNGDKMPSPAWVAYHGDAARTSSTPDMLPKDQWQDIRKQYAMEHIKRIQTRREQEGLSEKASPGDEASE
jgi:hypothetical protein